MATSPVPNHAALMDTVYRGQRHIYDLTRRYFLFGRDRLIARLDAQPGDAVLEMACGTGRNLRRIGNRWPGAVLHGFDISGEMLKSAHAAVGDVALLARGDATAFDPLPPFGRRVFDRVILSFALSMIPDWRAALDQAARLLAPGGSLHVVDFGDLAGLPAPLRALLRWWLARFHVTPRLDLVDAALALRTADRTFAVTAERGLFGYYRLVTITRLP
jgi:S-adenosylmethionine-diacylgycerolhomoserine-N-methlytransferase